MGQDLLNRFSKLSFFHQVPVRTAYKKIQVLEGQLGLPVALLSPLSEHQDQNMLYQHIQHIQPIPVESIILNITLTCFNLGLDIDASVLLTNRYMCWLQYEQEILILLEA